MPLLAVEPVLEPAPRSDAGPRAGLLGKIPRHGDFISRGFPVEDCEAWNDWLTAGLVRAHEVLGDGFDATHESAPAWRFVAGPGVFGSHWRAGAMAPSVDSAGRRYFVVLALDGLTQGQALAYGAPVSFRLVGTIYNILAEGLDADEATGRVQACAGELSPSAGSVFELFAQTCARALWWTDDRPDAAFTADASGLQPDLVLKLLVPDLAAGPR